MARLDDFAAEVKDPALRKKLQEAIVDVKRKLRFGLVFEEHVPETTALANFLIHRGAIVQRRDDPERGKLYRVISANGRSKMNIDPLAGGEPATLPAKDLLLVKGFGDPIYPALSSVGALHRGAPAKPHHAVINSENYHALQLLLYLYEGQVDCLYLDPPYNTGARDWTYNNRFVDSNDSYRHSKWLSFMDKRLSLAKRLLKPDGVLIVTIDEHEVHHLGLLLEKIFPEFTRQMVTIVVNPKGVTQGGFSRVEEYAFFCFGSAARVEGRGDDFLTPGVADEDDDDLEDDVQKRPRWKGLLRSGTNARRQDRKKMFYPVLIDPDRKAVVGTGETLPFDKEPRLGAKIDGYAAAWPVRRDGSFGNWGVGYLLLRRLIAQGYVSAGDYDPKRKTWAITYLSKTPQEQIAALLVSLKWFLTIRCAMRSMWFTHQPRHEGSKQSGIVPVCGELLNLAENTSVAQSCESFTYC